MPKPGPKKGTGGRPEVQVNWAAIDKLCALHAPANEIADYISLTESAVSYDTLDRRAKQVHKMTFAEYVKQKTNAHGKIRLRQAQMKVAVENLNPTMLIWLGKQYLGQKDQVEAIGNVTMHPFDGWETRRAKPNPPDAD